MIGEKLEHKFYYSISFAYRYRKRVLFQTAGKVAAMIYF